jgi:hypothetical protein
VDLDNDWTTSYSSDSGDIGSLSAEEYDRIIKQFAGFMFV